MTQQWTGSKWIRLVCFTFFEYKLDLFSKLVNTSSHHVNICSYYKYLKTEVLGDYIRTQQFKMLKKPLKNEINSQSKWKEIEVKKMKKKFQDIFQIYEEKCVQNKKKISSWKIGIYMWKSPIFVNKAWLLFT